MLGHFTNLRLIIWHITNTLLYIRIMICHFTNKHFKYISITIIWQLTQKIYIYICIMLGHFTKRLLIMSAL